MYPLDNVYLAFTANLGYYPLHVFLFSLMSCILESKQTDASAALFLALYPHVSLSRAPSACLFLSLSLHLPVSVSLRHTTLQTPSPEINMLGGMMSLRMDQEYYIYSVLINNKQENRRAEQKVETEES